MENIGKTIGPFLGVLGPIASIALSFFTTGELSELARLSESNSRKLTKTSPAVLACSRSDLSRLCKSLSTRLWRIPLFLRLRNVSTMLRVWRSVFGNHNAQLSYADITTKSIDLSHKWRQFNILLYAYQLAFMTSFYSKNYFEFLAR